MKRTAMKTRAAVWIVVLLFLACSARAQNINQAGRDIPRLTLSYNKTTNIIFPCPFKEKGVDVGSRDILVQKAGGAENILQVKAGKIGFEETNLTVITNDGSVYSFLLNYALVPSSINIQADKPILSPQATAVFSDEETTDKMKSRSLQVSAKKRAIKNIRDINNEAVLDLKGMYYADGTLYLQLYLQNFSVIDYDIKMLKIYVRDLKRSKRTATQELELSPRYVWGNTRTIKGRSEQTVVIALDKTTLPDKKQIEVELLEESGGRNLKIHLGNRVIMKAGAID